MEIRLKQDITLLSPIGETYIHGHFAMLMIANHDMDYCVVPIIRKSKHADWLVKTLFGKKAKTYLDTYTDAVAKSTYGILDTFLQIDTSDKKLKKFKGMLNLGFFKSLKMSEETKMILEYADDPLMYPLLCPLDEFLSDLDKVDNEESWVDFLKDNCIYFLPLEYPAGKRMLLDNMVTFKDGWRDYYISFDIPKYKTIYIDSETNELSYDKVSYGAEFKLVCITASFKDVYKRIANEKDIKSKNSL